MMYIVLSLVALIGSGLALYSSIKNYFINRDIQDTNKKITLLQTVIDAKNGDITKDEETVKQTGGTYEASKSSYDNSNKPK